MEYIIYGLRKTDKEVENKYDCIEIAKFEYDALSYVAKWCALYEIDSLGEMKMLNVHIS